jgi:hypothetical protein
MSHRMSFQSLDFHCPSQLSEPDDVSVWHGKEQFVIAMHDMPAICGCGADAGMAMMALEVSNLIDC